jgi:hypothetical protein
LTGNLPILETDRKHTSFLAFSQLGILECNRSTKTNNLEQRRFPEYPNLRTHPLKEVIQYKQIDTLSGVRKLQKHLPTLLAEDVFVFRIFINDRMSGRIETHLPFHSLFTVFSWLPHSDEF